MSASGKAKLKKKSLSSPTYNATDTTSIRNVFCAVKAKRKYKKKPQTDSELRMISFFVKVEKQQYFNHLQYLFKHVCYSSKNKTAKEFEKLT